MNVPKPDLDTAAAPAETRCDEPWSMDVVVRAWRRSRKLLSEQRVNGGHWVGQLSTSALSTATAISALALVRKHRTQSYVQRANEIDSAIQVACRWLLTEQNADGGFGDTNLSHSNIATSLLVLAAWQLAEFKDHSAQAAVRRGWQYCDRVGKWNALKRRYGKDKTFVAPILTNCALAGIVPWDDVPTLPFELAWLPQSWYRLAKLPVVSYAVPALVAIGQAKFHHRPAYGPLGYLRRRAIEPTLRVLTRMQPSSGGYLEAVPLTSFVLMCLADVGRGDHPVAVRAIDFLLASRLSDGSLPIDTNLAAWGTSLSISALEYGDEQPTVTPSGVRWLLSCQHWSDHPFTGARPGGWGWSNLSGAVPDSDDTPAALLALSKWGGRHCGELPMLDMQIAHAATQGLRWLLQLQNRDGGWPTFCRGWGTLPFDRSGCDLTAHALRALMAWQRHPDRLEENLREPVLHSIPRAVDRGFQFLAKRQNADGSWFPLWFGNQDRLDEENPIYGTSKVLLAYALWRENGDPNPSVNRSIRLPASDLADLCSNSAQRGIRYLVDHQNADGGWGGGASVPYQVTAWGAKQDDTTVIIRSQHRSSVEETGAAVEALIACRNAPWAKKIRWELVEPRGAHQQDSATNRLDKPASQAGPGGSTVGFDPTIMRALRWLVAAVEEDALLTSWPIGFYFAKLWYHERLYPMIAATAALGAAVEQPGLWLKSP